MNVADILNRLEIEPVNSGACGTGWIASPSGGEIPSLNPARATRTVGLVEEQDSTGDRRVSGLKAGQGHC